MAISFICVGKWTNPALNIATGDTLHNGRHSYNGAIGGRSDRALRAGSTVPPAHGLAAF